MIVRRLSSHCYDFTKTVFLAVMTETPVYQPPAPITNAILTVPVTRATGYALRPTNINHLANTHDSYTFATGTMDNNHAANTPDSSAYGMLHQGLINTEMLLKTAAFYFIQNHLPGTGLERGWISPETLLLSPFCTAMQTTVLLPNLPHIPTQVVQDMKDIARTIYLLGQRAPIPTFKVLSILQSAIAFARVLNNDGALTTLTQWREDLDAEIRGDVERFRNRMNTERENWRMGH